MSFLLIHGQWVVLAQMDILILGAMSSAEQVGLYRVASLAAGFVVIGTLAMRGVFNERLSNAWTTGDTELFKDRAALGCMMASAVGLPIAAVFVFFGAEFLGFAFGAEFKTADTVLLILTLGQVALLLRGSADAALAMTGHERAIGRMTTISVIVNLVLNLALIPILGATGAAAATAIALSVQSVQMWWLARRTLKVDMGFLASILPTARMVRRKLGLS